MAKFLKNKQYKRITLSTMATGLMLMPHYAFAQSPTQLKPVEGLADTVASFLTGGFARTAAIIAVAVIGYRWFSGRMELGRALTICGGIVLILGAPAIVTFIQSSVGSS